MRRLRARPASVALETIGWFGPWPTTNSWLGGHARGANQGIVDGHRLGHRQMLRTRCLRGTDDRGIRIVGVALDADHLLRIIADQIGADAAQDVLGAVLSCAVPGLKSWSAGISMRITSPSCRT